MTDAEPEPGSDSEVELQRLVRVDQIVTAAMAEARTGRRVDVDAIVAEHSDIADALRPALRGVASLERAAARAEQEITADQMPAQIGPYEVVRELGRGGMGLVYEARDDSLDRRVAIKVLPAQVSHNKAFVERFKREAHAAARLEHSNVVPVYGVDEENGQHYFVMKYVDGYGLDAITALYSKSQGRVRSGSGGSGSGSSATGSTGEGSRPLAARLQIARDLAAGRLGHFGADSSAHGEGESEDFSSLGRAYHRNVARIGLSVSSALGYAHARGVLHRDVKPGNVLVDGRGHVWVADFGLAKVDESDDLTREGDFVGTLRYTAPEQFQGHAEPRSDLYGLGLVLYEMLTLGPAVKSDSRAELVHELLYTVPKSPEDVRPEVPQDLARIVMKAIEKLPSERYKSADEMGADLSAFLDGRPIAARAPSALYLARLAVHRNRPLFTTIAVLALALTVAVGAYMQQLRSSAHAEAELAYRGQLSAAASSLQNADVPTARLRLADCPEELRTWEWRHLSASADQSLRTMARTNYPIQALRNVGEKLLIGHRGAAVLIDGEEREEVVLPGMRDERRETVGIWKLKDGWLNYHFRTGLWKCPDGGYPAGDTPSPEVAAAAGIQNLRVGRSTTAVEVNEEAGIVVLVERSGRIYVVDLETFEVLRSEATGQSSVERIFMSRDGSKVWAGGTDGQVVVWNTRDLTSRKIFSSRTAADAVAVSPDEETIAVGSGDHSIYLLDPMGQVRAQLVGHRASVTGIAFSPNGKWLASMSDDLSLRLWDAADGSLRQVLIGNPRRGRYLHFSADSRRLYSGNTAGIVQEWQVGPGGGRAALQGHLADVTAIGFAESGDRFASGGRDATIRIHDADSMRLDGLLIGHPSELMGLVWHDSDRQILSTDRRGHVMNWSVETGKLTWRKQMPDLVSEPVLVPGDPMEPIACYGCYSGEVSIVRLSDGAEVATTHFEGDSVTAVGTSETGDTIYAGTKAGDLLVLDPKTLAVTARLNGLHTDHIKAIAHLPEHGRIATASLDGVLALTESATLETVARTQAGGVGHSWYTDGLEDIAVSPDGRTLAVASHSRLVRLIDPSTGKIMLDLPGHESWVRRVAFAPDGETLLSTGSMSVVRVWDTVASLERKKRIDERLDLEMAAEAMLESWLGRRIRDLDDVDEAFLELQRRQSSHGGLERAARAVLHQFRSDHIVTTLERAVLGEDHELAVLAARQYTRGARRRRPLTYEIARLGLLESVRHRRGDYADPWLADLIRLDATRASVDPVVAALRVALARLVGDAGGERGARLELAALLDKDGEEDSVDLRTTRRVLSVMAPE